MKKNGGKAKSLPCKHKQTQKELTLSEIKFKELFDNVSSGIAVYQAKNDGEDFVFVDFNRAAERIDKIKKENLVGKSVLEAFPSVRDFGLFEVFRRVWKTGKAEDYPVSKYQDERIVGWRQNYVCKLPSGEIIAIYDDITEHKQSEMALKMGQQCFHAVADYSCSWEIWVNPDCRPIWTNPVSQQVTGYSVKEIMAMRDYPTPFIYEEDQGRVARAFRSALKGGRGKGFEFRIRRKDGAVIWAEMSWQPIYDEKGVSIGHRTSIRNINERKETEVALRSAKDDWKNIFESISDVVFILSRDHHILDANSAAIAALQLPKDKILGRFCYELFHCTDHPPAECPHEKLLTSGRAETADMEVEILNGIYMVTVAPVFDREGKIVKTIHIARDITDRKHTERMLRDSEEQYRALFEQAADSIVLIDVKTGAIVRFNDRAHEILGYTRDEFEKLRISDFELTESADETAKHIQKIIREGSDIFETKHRSKSGAVCDILVSSRAIYIGGRTFIQSIWRNITDLKQAEQARHRFNKELEAKNKELQSILYAASHDLKSPLVNIQGFSHELSLSCDLICSSLASKAKAADMEQALETALKKDIPESLDFILASTAKMDSLLSGLLDICRLDTTAMNVKPIDMNAMITDVAANIEYQTKEAAAEIDIEDLPSCLGDVAQIGRVFSNLLTNALKFLDESRPGRIHIYGSSRDNQNIYCVEDNGIGIAPEHQEKIFEIFYQLEPDKSRGEGLGLSIIRRIIEKHNGNIWVESKTGKGSKFFVSLPAA